MANYRTDVPLPANTSRFEDALRQSTAGIFLSSPGLNTGSAFNGLAGPPTETPILQPEALFDGWDFSWDLGDLQGLPPSQRGLEHGTVSIGHFTSISAEYE
jgi:hypothetical protein